MSTGEFRARIASIRHMQARFQAFEHERLSRERAAHVVKLLGHIQDLASHDRQFVDELTIDCVDDGLEARYTVRFRLPRE